MTELVVFMTLMLGSYVLAVAVVAHWSTREKPPEITGARWGDCSDEMFEAMREVDAMGLGGEPMLVGRLPPREATPPTLVGGNSVWRAEPSRLEPWRCKWCSGPMYSAPGAGICGHCGRREGAE